MKSIAIILTFVPFSLFSQLDSNKHYVYAGLNYTGFSGAYDVSSVTFAETVRLVRPIIGLFALDKRNNINEFQISEFEFTSRDNYTYTYDNAGNSILDGGSKNIRSRLGLSYFKVIRLNKNRSQKFTYGIGLGTSLVYDRLKTIPNVSNSFPTRNLTFYNTLIVKPVFNYMVSSKVFMGASLNIPYLNQWLSYDKSDNPVVPIKEQNIASYGFNSLPNYVSGQFTIGVGF